MLALVTSTFIGTYLNFEICCFIYCENFKSIKRSELKLLFFRGIRRRENQREGFRRAMAEKEKATTEFNEWREKTRDEEAAKTAKKAAKRKRLKEPRDSINDKPFLRYIFKETKIRVTS